MSDEFMDHVLPEPPVTRWYVCVPRAVFDQYWSLPWAEVVAATDAGVDGLTHQCDTPRHWGGWLNEVNPQPDVAFLREGDGAFKGRTLLWQQNWIGEMRVFRQLPSPQGEGDGFD